MIPAPDTQQLQRRRPAPPIQTDALFSEPSSRAPSRLASRATSPTSTPYSGPLQFPVGGVMHGGERHGISPRALSGTLAPSLPPTPYLGPSPMVLPAPALTPSNTPSQRHAGYPRRDVPSLSLSPPMRTRRGSLPPSAAPGRAGRNPLAVLRTRRGCSAAFVVLLAVMLAGVLLLTLAPTPVRRARGIGFSLAHKTGRQVALATPRHVDTRRVPRRRRLLRPLSLLNATHAAVAAAAATAADMSVALTYTPDASDTAPACGAADTAAAGGRSTIAERLRPYRRLLRQLGALAGCGDRATESDGGSARSDGPDGADAAYPATLAKAVVVVLPRHVLGPDADGPTTAAAPRASHPAMSLSDLRQALRSGRRDALHRMRSPTARAAVVAMMTPEGGGLSSDDTSTSSEGTHGPPSSVAACTVMPTVLVMPTTGESHADVLNVAASALTAGTHDARAGIVFIDRSVLLDVTPYTAGPRSAKPRAGTTQQQQQQQLTGSPRPARQWLHGLAMHLSAHGLAGLVLERGGGDAVLAAGYTVRTGLTDELALLPRLAGSDPRDARLASDTTTAADAAAVVDHRAFALTLQEFHRVGQFRELPHRAAAAAAAGPRSITLASLSDDDLGALLHASAALQLALVEAHAAFVRLAATARRCFDNVSHAAYLTQSGIAAQEQRAAAVSRIGRRLAGDATHALGVTPCDAVYQRDVPAVGKLRDAAAGTTRDVAVRPFGPDPTRGADPASTALAARVAGLALRWSEADDPAGLEYVAALQRFMTSEGVPHKASQPEQEHNGVASGDTTTKKTTKTPPPSLPWWDEAHRAATALSDAATQRCRHPTRDDPPPPPSSKTGWRAWADETNSAPSGFDARGFAELVRHVSTTVVRQHTERAAATAGLLELATARRNPLRATAVLQLCIASHAAGVSIAPVAVRAARASMVDTTSYLSLGLVAPDALRQLHRVPSSPQQRVPVRVTWHVATCASQDAAARRLLQAEGAGGGIAAFELVATTCRRPDVDRAHDVAAATDGAFTRQTAAVVHPVMHFASSVVDAYRAHAVTAPWAPIATTTKPHRSSDDGGGGGDAPPAEHAPAPPLPALRRVAIIEATSRGVAAVLDEHAHPRPQAKIVRLTPTAEVLPDAAAAALVAPQHSVTAVWAPSEWAANVIRSQLAELAKAPPRRGSHGSGGGGSHPLPPPPVRVVRPLLDNDVWCAEAVRPSVLPSPRDDAWAIKTAVAGGEHRSLRRRDRGGGGDVAHRLHDGSAAAASSSSAGGTAMRSIFGIQGASPSSSSSAASDGSAATTTGAAPPPSQQALHGHFKFLAVLPAAGEAAGAWDALFEAYFTAFGPSDRVSLYAVADTDDDDDDVAADHVEATLRDVADAPHYHAHVRNLTQRATAAAVRVARRTGRDLTRLAHVQLSSQRLTDAGSVALHAAVDAAVVALHADATGLRAARAMSMALPVVVTRCGAATEVATGDTAVLVDAPLQQRRGDDAVGTRAAAGCVPDVTQLAAALERVAAMSPGHRERLGAAAREQAERVMGRAAASAAWLSALRDV